MVDYASWIKAPVACDLVPTLSSSARWEICRQDAKILCRQSLRIDRTVVFRSSARTGKFKARTNCKTP